MNIITYLRLTNIVPAHPIANEPSDGDTLYRFWFGAYAETKIEVFADSDESAFEVGVEWLDANAPGHIVTYAEFQELLLQAAAELGVSLCDAEGEVAHAVVELAERDLTLIGHTTLKTGSYLLSHEWGFDVIGTEGAK
jgi:hypothetical protein